MTNLNVKTLFVDRPITSSEFSTIGNVDMNDLDRFINDTERAIKIVAVNLAGGVMSDLGGLTSYGFLEIQLSQNPTFDRDRSLFEAFGYWSGSINPNSQIASLYLGNFSDTMFELEPFSGTVAGSIIKSGGLYLNAQMNVRDGQVLTGALRIICKLYYK